MNEKWNITLKVSRQKQGETPHFDEYKMEADPDEYVLDVVERVWAFKDRTVCFRHACHHSTCGACGRLIYPKRASWRNHFWKDHTEHILISSNTEAPSVHSKISSAIGKLPSVDVRASPFVTLSAGLQF